MLRERHDASPTPSQPAQCDGLHHTTRFNFQNTSVDTCLQGCTPLCTRKSGLRRALRWVLRGPLPAREPGFCLLTDQYGRADRTDPESACDLVNCLLSLSPACLFVVQRGLPG